MIKLMLLRWIKKKIGVKMETEISTVIIFDPTDEILSIWLMVASCPFVGWVK